MKKLALLLCALALLSGCKGKEEPRWTPSPLPSPAAVTPSPTTAPTELFWGKNFGLEDIDPEKLPTAVATAIDASSAVSQSGVDFFLLGTVPGDDISLYGFTLSGSGQGILLRRGDGLIYFPQSYMDPSGTALPNLIWRDLDGDGAEELAVSYTLGGGAQAHCAELHVYEWDDGWTDHVFSPEVYNALIKEALTVKRDGQTLTVSYGRDHVSYSAGTGVTTISLYDSFQDMVFFQLGTDRLGVSYGIRALADGLHDMATLQAEVVYQDGDFTLDSLRLLVTTGV